MKLYAYLDPAIDFIAIEYDEMMYDNNRASRR